MPDDALSSGGPARSVPGGLAAGAQVEWVQTQRDRVTVHAPRGTRAATLAPRELEATRPIIEALDELLEPDAEKRRLPVDIYLVDPLPEVPAFLSSGNGEEEGRAPADAVGEGGILRVARPETGGDSLALPLARLLVPRWFGPQAASATTFIEGIAGLVAARTGAGPSLQEAEGLVRADLAAGRAVSVVAPPRPAGPGPAAPPDPAATLFVAHLVENYGTQSLGQLLSRFDPARRDEAAIAVYQQPLAALSEAWLGKLQRPQRRRADAGSFRYLLALLRPYRWRHAEIVLYQLINALTAVSMPLASGCVVRALGPPNQSPDAFCDAVAPPPLTPGRLAAIIAVLGLIYLIDNLISHRRATVETDLFLRVINQLRERMFSRLQRLSHHYYARAKTGDIISRLSADTNMLQSSLTELFSTASLMTLTAVAAASTAMLKSPYVGVLVLLVVPGFMLANRVFGRRFSQAMLRVQELNGEVLAVSQESLSAHAVVKAYGLEKRVEASYSGRLLGLAKASLSAARVRQLLDMTVNMSVVLGQLLVVGVGGFLVLRNLGDVGTITTLLILLPTIMVRMSLLISIQSKARAGSGSLVRITEVLDAPVDVEDKPGAGALPPLSQEIRLEGVTFGYGDERPVLCDLDLTIPAGASVGLVGGSGSGKSTMVNLLLRFWDPQEGRVTFDGHDLREVTLKSLHDQIGIVFQEAFVFNSTVRDNIAIGRLDATDAEIEEATQAAELADFIASLPAGYDTVLGERGVRMSGGQRQRLAIARALIRNPRVLILDEPTSALDAHTEAEILETLAAASRGRTTITITHRLALAVAADFVIVLDRGRVAERGTHVELVKAGGLYQRLWEEQTGQASEPAFVGEGADRLGSIPIFATLAEPELARLASRLVRERFVAEQEIVRQGDPADKLYMIGRGEAEVVVDDGRSERVVNRLREGDYFGEYTVFTKEPRTATVRAATGVEAFSLDQEDLIAFVEQQPTVRAAIAQFLAERRAAYTGAERAAGVDTSRRFQPAAGFAP